MKVDDKLLELEEEFGSWVESNRVNEKCSLGVMSQDLYPYTSIFSPIKVNRTIIKNRVVMESAGSHYVFDEYGRPSVTLLTYLAARAKGGVGLITTGLIPVSYSIDHARTAYTGWRDLAQTVHACGSKIFIQLTPGFDCVKALTPHFMKQKLPEMNSNFHASETPGIPLSDKYLKQIIKNIGQAAIDAQEYRLDGVYIHGREEYLLKQIANSAFGNRGLDEYKDPTQFGIELVSEIRRRVGESFPIMYRLDLPLMIDETCKDKTSEMDGSFKFENGRTIQDIFDYIDKLVACGVDVVDVGIECYDNWGLPYPPEGMPAGCVLYVSKIIKEHFEKKNILSNVGVKVPVVAVGKLGYPDLAEKAIRDRDCDMVMLGRPLLADPDWCNKAHAGRVDDIRPCMACDEGCINESVRYPRCSVNPHTGNEDRYPSVPNKTLIKKKIAVVGAGPAGCVFATTACRRGHDVTVFEASEYIGGKLIPGSVPKIKFDVRNYIDYLVTQVHECEKENNLKLKLNTHITTLELKEQGFDSVVFASGTNDINPSFEGRESTRVVQAIDLLNNPELLGDAKSVGVVGGGVVGCEVAYWLASEYGCFTTVIEMQPHFMLGACTVNRNHLIHELDKYSCDLINCAKVVSFEEGIINIDRNVSPTVPDPYNTWQPILPANVPNPLAKEIKQEVVRQKVHCDLVVLAMGGVPDADIYYKALSEHIAPEVFNIGDSDRAGRVLEAARAGYLLGISI